MATNPPQDGKRGKERPCQPQGPIVIGITGGIAAGKTTLSGILARRFGAVVISADEIGHELLSPGTEVYDEVVRHHGKRVLNPDGTINRKALAQIVFFDRQELEWLNRLTHPRIARRVREEISRLRRELPPCSLVVVDAALLYEMGLEAEVDYVVAVVAPEGVRLERLLAQGMPEREARARMASQMPQEEKAKRADFVVEGDAPLEEMERRVAELVSAIKARRSGGKGDQ